MRQLTWVARMAALATVAGCAEGPVAPQGEVVLESLSFAHGDIIPGDRLVLVARPKEGERFVPERIMLRSSSGESREGVLDPYAGCPEPVEGDRSTWSRCPDGALTQLIAVAGGEVGVGFKEADAARGVDETGLVLTSDATKYFMVQWLRDQGVTVRTVSLLMPAIFGNMDASENLVSLIRGHLNVDYVEPLFHNTLRLAHDGPDSGVALDGSLISVIPTTGDRGLRVRPGDTVTATYRQPDGSLLTATVRVGG